MIRHKIRIVLLGLGVIAGYGSGIAHWAHCRHHRQAAFEEHIAHVCVDAARGSTHPDGYRW